MRSIVIGKSNGENVSVDLDTLLSTRMLVTADSGGGKTFFLKKLCETTFREMQIIIIDPEGEFSPLRKKYDFVLVGPGGDTPADVRSAAMLAQKLLELRASAICDIYDMKPSARHTWVRLFLEALIEAPKSLRHPCMVIVDEAHLFDPENGKGSSEASDAMKGLCTRGRKRLLCPVFATQRLATLSKDSSSMLLNRFIGPTFEDLNRKRALECMSVSKEHQAQFMKEIQLLDPGNFYALGRAVTREMKLVHIGAISTPHGQDAIKYETAPPPAPSKVRAMLPQLADLPKVAEEKAKTESELRTEVRKLTVQLQAQAKSPALVQAAPPSPKVAEKQRKLADLDARIHSAENTIKKVFDTASAYMGKPRPKILTASPISVSNAEKHPGRLLPVREVSEGETKLRSGAERMLAALAQWYPNGMSEGQMRSHAGLKKSGTYSAYMSDLRRGQYVEERGNEIYVTAEGLGYCMTVPPAPKTTEDVVAIWEPKLRDGARRMLKIIVGRKGDPISREDLMIEAKLTKSGTTSAYLSDLKTARLIEVSRDGFVTANKQTLFL